MMIKLRNKKDHTDVWLGEPCGDPTWAYVAWREGLPRDLSNIRALSAVSYEPVPEPVWRDVTDEYDINALHRREDSLFVHLATGCSCLRGLDRLRKRVHGDGTRSFIIERQEPA